MHVTGFSRQYPNGGCISWRREEDGLLLDEITAPRAAPSAFVDVGPVPMSTPRAAAAAATRWFQRGGNSGATPPAKGSAGDLSSMLNSFAARFSVALNRGDGAENSPPADSGVTDPAVVSARRARIAKREQVFACKEVAAQLIGAQEVLDLQKLAREHCRRPCETFRATMLRAAAAVGAATTAADSGGAQRSARLATIEAEAEAAALATLGGGVGGGSSGGVSGPELAPDAFVDALTARVMRAVEVTLGAAIDREARAALHRRPAVLQDFDKAAALTHRLAFSRLHRHARPLVARAVARVRERSLAAAAALLAPQAATQGLGHDPAQEFARWGLKMAKGPPPPVPTRAPALDLPPPAAHRGGDGSDAMGMHPPSSDVERIAAAAAAAAAAVAAVRPVSTRVGSGRRRGRRRSRPRRRRRRGRTRRRG